MTRSAHYLSAVVALLGAGCFWSGCGSDDTTTPVEPTGGTGGDASTDHVATGGAGLGGAAGHGGIGGGGGQGGGAGYGGTGGSGGTGGGAGTGGGGDGGHAGTAGGGGGGTGGGGSCPSGVCMPTGDLVLSGHTWHLVFADDFTKDAATGSWGTTDASEVVYTGDHSGQWCEYPDGWPSTYTGGQPGYQPAQVLSVHDGTLDFYLRSYNGLAAGANPSPILPGGSQYQTYGVYTTRIKLTYDDANHLNDYYDAWLLWPNSDSDWQSAESDFPEANLSDTSVNYFAHYGGSGSQDYGNNSLDFTQWHTFTQEWGPGYRSYYLDGQLMGTSTHQVYSQPERWQLQTEPSGSNNGSSGHELVD